MQLPCWLSGRLDGGTSADDARSQRWERRVGYGLLVALVLSAGAVSFRSLVREQGTVPSSRGFMESATLVILITGLCVASTQLALVLEQMRDRETKDRQDGALWYSLSDPKEVLKSLQELDKRFDRDKYADEPVAYADFAGDPEIVGHLENLFAHWERLALTVYAETTDRRMAFESFGSLVVEYCDRFSQFLDPASAGQKPKNPRAYAYVKELHEDWKRQLGDAGEVMAPGDAPYYVREYRRSHPVRPGSSPRHG
jgi:hypothetical protein